ncbi:Scr1 family TA system antitoxin-like transcriptional regulator [Streptomyces sp. NPDC091272]|uniref:helix-turn-helix domain-containing protein n=1 Tax=Streptomyces sp. NPDC091272 TaxID=3365981 RepID=UPI00381505F1
MVNKKDLGFDGSPVPPFGARLRRLREERGWTQKRLASLVGCTEQHISAVETGRRAPTNQFAAGADTAFKTGDYFARHSRTARRRALIEGFPQYLEHEARAAEIRLYEVGVVPGLLQTPEYSATLEADAVRRGAISQEQAEERVALVARRQASLVRSPPPLVIAVLDESCIRRPMGSPAIMNAQLARLLEFADQPTALLQIAPFTMGERRPFSLPVTVLTLPDRPLMSYAESAQRGHLERESAFVLPLLSAYHQLQVGALSQAESLAMINEVRKGTL